MNTQYQSVWRPIRTCVGLDVPVPGTKPPGSPRKQRIDVEKQDMRANDLTQNDPKDRAKGTGVSRKAEPSNKSRE